MKKKSTTQSARKTKTTNKSSRTGARITASAGFKKEYLKAKDRCKVTFNLPEEAAPKAKKVTLVGEFCNWNIDSNPMKLNKSGTYTTTVELKKGREYRFRYLVDGHYWVNDWHADKYVQNPYGGDDSVVSV